MKTLAEPISALGRAVELIQEGVDTQANCRVIFDHYYPWVRRFFRRRGFAPEDAEDLAQETLVSMLEEIGTFRGDSSFNAWVFAMAANRYRNRLRWAGQQKRKAPEVHLDETLDVQALRELQLPADVPSPAHATYDRQRLSELLDALGELPEQMRQCLLLHLERGLKYREIAILLKISINTVKAHIFQARARLRTELGEHLEEWSE